MRWDGATWNIVQTPNPGTELNHLNSVAALSTNDVWAVGLSTNTFGASQTLVIHWDGTAWSEVPSANATQHYNNLKGIVALSANAVWAVGDYYVSQSGPLQTLVEHWDGTTWTVVSSPNLGTSSSLVGVAAVSANDIWAVGELMGKVVMGTLVERFLPPCSSSTPVPPTGTPCAFGQFSDVPHSSTFYPHVTCLVNRGIISGYADCTFRPNYDVTRGQLSKIVGAAANLPAPAPGQQTFEDVPTDHTFWQWIEALSSAGVINGYACGGAGEPCVPPGNRPYFRPSAGATRGQISKIVANAAGLKEPVPGGQQTYEDVPAEHPFYLWVERLSSRGYMGGYPCGAMPEPCVPPWYRPYFRPGNNVTRGQASKIVANTFFPACGNPLK
jgi:hypothetical protein